MEAASGLPAWFQYVTPVMAFTALAAVGLYVILQYVKGKKIGNGNGKGGAGDVTLAQLHDDVRSLTEKVDQLRLDVVGKYVTRDHLDSIGERVDDLRERVIKAETRIEMQEEQIRELFARLNAEKKRQKGDDNG